MVQFRFVVDLAQLLIDVAVTSKDCGIVGPKALATLELITSLKCAWDGHVLRTGLSRQTRVDPLPLMSTICGPSNA